MFYSVNQILSNSIFNMFLFPDLPIEISVMIDKFLQEELKKEEEMQKAVAYSILSAIGYLVASEFWNFWSDEKQKNHLKESSQNAWIQEDPNLLSTAIKQCDGFYFNKEQKKAHLFVNCAFCDLQKKMSAKSYPLHLLKDDMDCCGSCMKDFQ